VPHSRGKEGGAKKGEEKKMGGQGRSAVAEMKKTI